MIGQLSTNRRRRLPTAERREAIIVAAAQLFREVGYATASIDAIAALVGISGPGIYRHYKGKSAILIAVIERAVERAEKMIETDIAGAPRAQLLERIAASLVQHSLDQSNSLDLLRMATPDLTRDDRSRLEFLGNTIRDLIARSLRVARPNLPKEDCRVLADAALGMIGHISTNTDRNANEIARYRAAVGGVLKA